MKKPDVSGQIEAHNTDASAHANIRELIPTTPDDINAVPTTRTVNGKALSSNITLTASDISAAPAGFGIGTTAKVIFNTNLLDTLALGKSGFYRGTNVTNAPVTGWCYFQIISDSANYSSIKAWPMAGGEYRALYENGTLTRWAADGPEMPLIVGTQTASTGSFTGAAPTLSELYNGLTIRYWLPYAGSGNATLNLTLKNGTPTGAKNIYVKGTTRLTTHYSAGSMFFLTYFSAANVGGTTYEGWWCDADYWSATVS